jgi:hypothetical protein
MKCSHPQCTGKHGNQFRHSELCPAALVQHRAAQLRYRLSEQGRATWRRYYHKLFEDSNRLSDAISQHPGQPPDSEVARLGLRIFKLKSRQYYWRLQKRIECKERLLGRAMLQRAAT